jgi:AraC-like DNA-binding protein
MHRGGIAVESEQFHDFDQFRAVIEDFCVPIKIATEHRASFNSRVRVTTIDETRLSDVAADPHTVHRSPHPADAQASHYYNIAFQVSGQTVLCQDGREDVLRPGDSAICDTQRPYQLAFNERSRSIIMTVPRDSINLPPSLVSQVCAKSFTGSSKVSGLINPFISQLASGIGAFEPNVGRRLINHAVGLFSTLLFDELGANSVSESVSSHRELLRKIYFYVDQHLSDPDLSPERIASDHFISTRYLYTLFQAQSTSVSGWIRCRRLEMCRQELLDPAYTSQSIASIARRWALNDPAHFSHIFKIAYGCTPSEMRQRTP